MLKVLILILIAEVWTAVGQVLFKKSTNTIEFHSLRSLSSITLFVKRVVSKPMIWVGLFSMAVGMAVWLMALAQADLSLVFSVGSIQYVMILFLAHYLLDEKIEKMKLVGTLLVILGIFLITIS